MNIGDTLMSEIRYGKPSMTNLPKELGEKIFKQILNSKPNLAKLQKKSLEKKLDILRERSKNEKKLD